MFQIKFHKFLNLLVDSRLLHRKKLALTRVFQVKFHEVLNWSIDQHPLHRVRPTLRRRRSHRRNTAKEPTPATYVAHDIFPLFINSNNDFLGGIVTIPAKIKHRRIAAFSIRQSFRFPSVFVLCRRTDAECGICGSSPWIAGVPDHVGSLRKQAGGGNMVLPEYRIFKLPAGGRRLRLFQSKRSMPTDTGNLFKARRRCGDAHDPDENHPWSISRHGSRIRVSNCTMKQFTSSPALCRILNMDSNFLHTMPLSRSVE